MAKYNPTLVIGALFLFMVLVLFYMQRQRKAPAMPPPTGVPLKKYPDWRILPYDPYYTGPPKSDPYSLRLGQVAPLAPSVWSSRYNYDPYDIPG